MNHCCFQRSGQWIGVHLFFKFSGRINRAKYWLAALIYAVIYLVLAVVGYATDQSVVYQAINGMLNIVIFISSLAVGIKRLHDRNKSGWYLAAVLYRARHSGDGRRRDRT